jgi:uncharacterized protein YjgD (DUF1641 family)
MAIPISFTPAPHDPREALRARVERAPDDHAEAVLAAYDLLQMLHDHGMLDIARSALAASDELLGTAVDQVNTPEAIRAIRNLLFWRGVLGRIEPEWFKGIFQAVPDALSQATKNRDEPVSLFSLVRRMRHKDSLRGLSAAVDFLESFGRHLHALEKSRRP